jgi:hypothetical protein
MNKKIIRIAALMLIISPWILIGSTFKDVLYIVLSIVILSATIDISKKKKEKDASEE